MLGGSRGIGLASAAALRSSGFAVAVTYKNAPPSGSGAFAVKCDLGRPDEISEVFSAVEASLGSVDVLVANAGIAEFAPMIGQSTSRVAKVIETNLNGHIFAASRAARGMIRGRWGRIILVSSVAALVGVSWGTAYAASKAGMIGFARSAARELGRFGVTVNVVLPGLIDTDLTRSRPDWAAAANTSPIGRPGTPEEVANVIRFLASTDASYVTGAVLPVDGGLAMGAW